MERGTNAVVTGASRGLGRAIAVRLARRGVRVVMVARGAAALEAAAAAIRDEGGEAHALPLDVSAPGAAGQIAGAAAALVGPIDLLVNNAGSLGPVPLAPLAETSDEALERALAVNLLAPFRLTRALVGGMVARGGGIVLHVSSDAAVEAYPGWGAYGASKAAIDHLGRIWAAELEGTGVRVVAVDPGEMDTTLHAAALPDADPADLARPEAVAAAIVERLDALPSGARLEVAS